MIRIVIADDETLVREGFRAILEAEEDLAVVGEAASGREAVEVAVKHRADVVLMDVRMPRGDGIEATRRLTEQVEAPRVLVLTTFDLDEYVYGALRAGASGFLLKDAPRSQLTSGIRTVAAGDALLAPAVTRRLIQRFVDQQPTRRAEVARLTPREKEVLTLIGTGLNNQEIAGRLYLSEATVRTHVSHILSKLNLRDRIQAVVLAFEAALVPRQ